MTKKRFYPWEEFLADMYNKIIPALEPHGADFDGVWGPPRGGFIPAVMLSHELDLPLVTDPGNITPKTIIIDDIADTGKTLAPFYGKNFIVTLFYHRQSIVIPSIWCHEKKKAWVVFPWEKGWPAPRTLNLGRPLFK